MIIGAHVPGEQPLAEAESVGAECIQMFVGPPQSWKKPPIREDAEELKASGAPIYVHAPYLINVASPNNRVRIPSRKIMHQTLERAGDIGAAGVIVHAGHAEDGIDNGFGRWRKAIEEIESEVPLFIENTAGGDNALGRYVDTLGRLWDELDGLDVGLCFDTCHAHASGEELEDVVERTLKAVGRIDVLHCNDSRDPAGSGRDRHANFAAGTIAEEDLIHMVSAAGCDVVICETPWPAIADDITLLRTRLGP